MTVEIKQRDMDLAADIADLWSDGHEDEAYRRAARHRIAAEQRQPSGDVAMRVAAIEAAFHAIAGDDADPHLLPETWAYAEAVATAVLSTLPEQRQEAATEGEYDPECQQSPDGKHQVDTSMESGSDNCFYCEKRMGRSQQ